MTYQPLQASYHFVIGYDQYEVHFKLNNGMYNVTIFCNNQRKNDMNERLECSTSTASEILSDYLTKKNSPHKLF